MKDRETSREKKKKRGKREKDRTFSKKDCPEGNDRGSRESLEDPLECARILSRRIERVSRGSRESHTASHLSDSILENLSARIATPLPSPSPPPPTPPPSLPLPGSFCSWRTAVGLAGCAERNISARSVPVDRGPGRGTRIESTRLESRPMECGEREREREREEKKEEKERETKVAEDGEGARGRERTVEGRAGRGRRKSTRCGGKKKRRKREEKRRVKEGPVVGGRVKRVGGPLIRSWPWCRWWVNGYISGAPTIPSRHTTQPSSRYHRTVSSRANERNRTRAKKKRKRKRERKTERERETDRDREKEGERERERERRATYFSLHLSFVSIHTSILFFFFNLPRSERSSNSIISTPRSYTVRSRVL